MRIPDILKHTATLGPIGYLPVAPGTFGTIVCVIFLFIVRPSGTVLLLLIPAFAVLGTISSHFAEISFGEKDSHHIVIDEFTGFLVSMLFLDISILNLMLAFIFFRFFDILKPPPVRSFETLFKGGTGVMMDDIMAGIYANITVRLCNLLIKTL
ncbi:phosphatidylglycerophosphatase A [bacterium BMS3Bbin05]|nr:phosphatidylglycerophosphatase A [bacterium BMS3Bbin05]